MAHFVFPKWTNALGPALVTAAVAVPLYAVGMVWYGFSPVTTDVGYQPDQPVRFSHATHAGTLGIDCRYCHNTVERAAKAAIPPTETCMNCHTGILTMPDASDPTGTRIQNQMLQTVVDSWRTGQPIQWRRVHDLPDYAYFNHSAHVTRGVSCVECHGRVDRMEVVEQVETLSMGWCLDCHRDHEDRIRPQEFITQLDWDSEQWDSAEGGRDDLAALVEHLNPLTDCSTCHR